MWQSLVMISQAPRRSGGEKKIETTAVKQNGHNNNITIPINEQKKTVKFKNCVNLNSFIHSQKFTCQSWFGYNTYGHLSRQQRSRPSSL